MVLLIYGITAKPHLGNYIFRSVPVKASVLIVHMRQKLLLFVNSSNNPTISE